MTRGPRRLLDDPDFKWETGCDLADERSLVGTYDLEGSKQRLLAAIALPLAAGGPAASPAGSAPGPTIGDGMPAIRAGSRWSWVAKPAAAVVAGAGAIAGAFWLGMQTATVPDAVSDPVRAPVAPIEAPIASPIVPAVPVETRMEPPAAEAPPARPGVPVGVVRPPAVVAPVTDPVVVADPVVADPVPTPDALVAAEPPSPTPRALVLSPRAREADLLNRAGDALGDGAAGDARALYEAYLAEFPRGDFTIEAKIGLLEALRAIDDQSAYESVASMAAQLQDLPEFSGRRDQILRLRAESLVLLGRCEEALLLSEELSARTSVEIRRSCRRRE